MGEKGILENEGVFGGFFVIQNMDEGLLDIPCYYGEILCGESNEPKSESQRGALP